MYRIFFKRLADVLLAFIGFLVCLPIFLLLVIVLFIENDGKPFFYQTRPGKKGRVFRIVKFKTMNDRRSEDGTLMSDAQRLTSVGKFIRRASLDEIPQLLNVIKGDMSLIGPRPLLVEYLPLYNDRQKLRHKVRPGITGWAQVNGRNAIGWHEKFDLDVWYVEHVSFKLDCKIFLLTLKKVVIKEGVASQTSATMEKFTGN